MVHSVDDLILDARSQSGEVCAVSGYTDDQLRMILRMILRVNHFFFIHYVELNMLSAIRDASFSMSLSVFNADGWNFMFIRVPWYGSWSTFMALWNTAIGPWVSVP